MQGQRTNAQSFRCHQWSVSHVKRLDTTSKTLNSRRDIIGIANFTSDAFKVQCVGCGLRLMHLQDACGCPVSARIAKRCNLGTTSRKSWSFFPARSTACTDRPVTLPPGRDSDATRPVPTGSPATAKTIGMVEVARLVAMTFSVPPVRIRSTPSLINSLAISRALPRSPPEKRCSMTTVARSSALSSMCSIL